MTPKDFMLKFGAEWTRRYKAPYAWQYGRDTKAIKILEGYVTTVYPTETDKAIEGLIVQFLADGDSFLGKVRHPLSELCKCPSKWFPKEQTTPERVVEKAKDLFVEPTHFGDEEFKERWLNYCVPDPVKAGRAFLKTGKILKVMNATHYEMALEILKELLGPKLSEKFLTTLNGSSNDKAINMKGRYEQVIEGNETGVEGSQGGLKALAEI